MNKYDVIIVNFNGEKIIKKCLESIYSSTIAPSKVIIYDNGSKDNSILVIKEHFPKVNLIEGKNNIGFSRGNLEALKRATNEFILFMNNDVLLDKNCAQELLIGFFEQDLAILNPLILSGWKKTKRPSVYSFGAELNKSGFGYSLYDKGPDRQDLTCFSGACFMAKRRMIKEINFEPSFFLYYEEPVISTKALIKDYKIGRKKSAICYHLENYSSPKNAAEGISFRQFFAIQNRFYMLGKYWPLKDLLLAMPLNIIHLFYNLFFFLKNGQIKKMSIIYLAFYKLRQGRKHFKILKDRSWINKLPRTKISSIFALKQKVYR